MEWLETIHIPTFEEPISTDVQHRALQALEGGKVVYFPALPFPLYAEEKIFLSPEKVDPKAKNISYDIRKDRLAGTLHTGDSAELLKKMIKRYALLSRAFLGRLIPHYSSGIVQAKTSFRPVEIAGRKNPSYRKDDTLLHVDSFPSNPTKGQRILRIFTNVNPDGKPRVWRLGEPFENVSRKFSPKVSTPFLGFATLLKLLKITKDYRTLYDHYMLKMHDMMKGDANYQKNVLQTEVRFPAGSSWMVYTDQVSHAATAGQHVLEQTFHLPVQALKNECTSPLRVLEKQLKRKLVVTCNSSARCGKL
jgi:hypothetical protein